MSTTESRISKRRVGAIIAAAATFAIVSASAATLGGLDIETLGADSSTVVAPVTKGVTLSFDTEYAAGGYIVSGIILEAKEGKIPDDAEVKVTLADQAGESLAQYTRNGDGVFVSEETNIRAHDVANASVVINGAVQAAEVN